MKSLTQFLEAQKFLVKGHTSNQSNDAKMKEYYDACKKTFGDNNHIIKTFTELIEDINKTENFDIEDIPEEYWNDPEKAGNYVGFCDYLEDSTSEDDWHYNAYYDTIDAIKVHGPSAKESKINELVFLWVKANS